MISPIDRRRSETNFPNHYVSMPFSGKPTIKRSGWDFSIGCKMDKKGFFGTPNGNPKYTAAIRRVSRMDATDKKYGFASPIECDHDQHLRTCITALSVGLIQNDQDAMWDAMVMMQQLEHRLRLEGSSTVQQ